MILVYINYIVVDINASVIFFTDDTSLYVIVDSPFSCAEVLNQDLDIIHSLAEKWLVNFNANKTENLLIYNQ